MRFLAKALLVISVLASALTGVSGWAHQFSCADIMEREFDARTYFEVLEPEISTIEGKRAQKKAAKKIKKLLKKFAKVQENEDKTLGSHEIAVFSGRLFGLLRKGLAKTPEEAIYTLAQEQLLKDKIVLQFARDGRLDETRLRNRVRGLLSHPRFRRLTDAVFYMWFLPEIRSFRLDAKVVESVREHDGVVYDAALRKDVKKALRLTRLRSLYLKLMTITGLAYGGLQVHEQHAKLEEMRTEQAKQFDENVMKPLELAVEEMVASDAELDVSSKHIREFEQEFAAKHGRAPTPEDPDYQLILKIYAANP